MMIWWSKSGNRVVEWWNCKSRYEGFLSLSLRSNPPEALKLMLRPKLASSSASLSFFHFPRGNPHILLVIHLISWEMPQIVSGKPHNTCENLKPVLTLLVGIWFFLLLHTLLYDLTAVIHILSITDYIYSCFYHILWMKCVWWVIWSIFGTWKFVWCFHGMNGNWMRWMMIEYDVNRF